jgi:heptosyltransferase-2/heptosyltransferase-3
VKESLLFVVSALVSIVVNALGFLRGPGRGTERILVVKLDHVGDVVLSTPAIRALRDAHPDAAIDALVAPGSAFVLRGSTSVDRVLTYDSPRYRRASEDGAGREPAAPHVPLEQVVTEGYTTIVELRGDRETALDLPFRTGARRRVDRGTVRIRDWILRRIEGDRPQLHEVETNLEIVRPLLTREIQERLRDATPERAPLEVPRVPEAERSLARKLETLGLDLREPIVSIHAGAAWRPRAWDPARFAAIADWIQGHYHAQVVLVGSDDERDIEASVRANVKGGRTFWLTGAIAWDELHALLARSLFFLGNDSGPAHLAAAAGAPSVVLFGPQDSRRFGPWSVRTLVLHHRAPCWPCAQIRCVRPEAPCVNDIQIAEVKAAIARLLDVTVRAADLGSRRIAGEETG